MGKKKKKKKIDTSHDGERLKHNAFADLLQGSELSDLPEGPTLEPDATQTDEATIKERLNRQLHSVDKIVLRKQRKGRGGKTVTLIEKLEDCPQGVLEELASQLKKALGTGATLEDGVVVLQGDQRDRTRSWLSKKDIKKIVG